MKDPRDSRIDAKTIIAIVVAIIAVCVFLYKFVKKVVEAGRLKELLITTPLLILVLYGMYLLLGRYDFIHDIFSYLVYYGTPFIVYALYWVILLAFFPKITCAKSSSYWAERNWWWTLDGWEFEEEVARVFRLNGYKVKVTKKTGDGGTDLIMYKGNYKYLVQCKHYQNEVPPEPLRALNGLREDYGADRLIMVASSGVTKAGQEFIKNKPYFKILTLEDVIAMGLRPCKEGKEDTEENIDTYLS